MKRQKIALSIDPLHIWCFDCGRYFCYNFCICWKIKNNECLLLSSPVRLFMYAGGMHVCTHVCKHMYKFACVCLPHSLSTLPTTSGSHEPHSSQFSQASQPAYQGSLLTLHPSSTRVLDELPCLSSIDMGSGTLNSSLHVYTANTFSPGPSPQTPPNKYF